MVCDGPNFDGFTVFQELAEVDDHPRGWERSSGRHHWRPQPFRLLGEIVPAINEVSCDRFAMLNVPPVAVGPIG